ncbi:3-phosphoshikimate 1-carboxyvinyltransferase [Zongyangia hominis]|uniref:3-phosphoshikimate 1-carboxyvinyltransferase n=1 Tax=Zongyangia hominis TaxID=2763677 RepID=A0A926EFD2_9FIRM|nr:3-phosphoshikimate 1-carboxyvinyltransferase [Zongyangia hominis]MBC8571149.1 3-phosphoshikimate 1-carboxyvinyltransferase [Zongyangia hominis]
MDVMVSASTLRGTASAVPSKSMGHRSLICAALAGGGTVSGLRFSADISATVDALSAMGFSLTRDGGAVRAGAFTPPSSRGGELPVIDCNESGSTLRFLIPVAAALGESVTFTGRGRLPSRPIGVLTDALSQHGVFFSGDSLPLSMSGYLKPGHFRLPGNVSSQYISGLLFALPLLEGDSVVEITTPLESKPYIDLTVKALGDFGIKVTETSQGYAVRGNQRYEPRDCAVEGDYSNAAFFACGAALGGAVLTTGLDPASLQGDRDIFPLLERMGAKVTWETDGVRVQSGPLRGIDIDASQIPDLVPVLAVTAAFCEGETTIYNAGRLRLKESDRLSAVSDCLRRLGAQVEEGSDRLKITGKPRLLGGEVDGCNDHRIVMAMAVAALRCEGPVIIRGAQAVEKSYGAFFEDYQALGGNCHVIRD